MKNEINSLKNFAEGNLNASDFEQLLYYNNKIITILSDTSLIDYSKIYLNNYSTIYDYLISLNYKLSEHRMEAHFTVCRLLDELNIKFEKSNAYNELHNLLLDTQPKYIDIDLDFFEKNIWKSEYAQLSKSEQKKKIKEKINVLFKFHKKSPKWIQSPNWPIENNRPLYFLGQFEIKDCNLFHDNGYVYLFVNQNNDIKTVVQFY